MYRIEIYGEDVKDVSVIWIEHPIAVGHRLHIYNRFEKRQVMQVTQIVHVCGESKNMQKTFAWVKEVPA